MVILVATPASPVQVLVTWAPDANLNSRIYWCTLGASTVLVARRRVSCTHSDCVLASPSNRRSASAVTRGPLFSTQRKSRLRIQSKRQTHSVSERGRRSTSCINFSVRILATTSPCSKRYADDPKTCRAATQGGRRGFECQRPQVEPPHHRSLVDYSTEVERRFTAKVFRPLRKGCTGRTSSSRTFCRHCTLDGSSGHPSIV